MNRAEPHFKFLIYVAVIILINIVGMSLFFRIDLTANNIYSLSKASRQAVSTLSEPLTIKVFFTEDLPAPHNNTQRYLRDLLQEYSIHANDYFNYRFYNVTPKQTGESEATREKQELARSYGIHPVEIQSVEQDEVKFKKAYMGLVLIHGDLTEKIQPFTSTDRIEYQLTTAINTLNNKISRLAGLEEKIRLKFVMSPSLEKIAPYIGLNELSELPDKMRETVSALNSRNYNQLSYESVEPTAASDIEALAGRYDLRQLQWPDLPEENIGAGRGAIGLVMQYKDRVKTVQLLDVVRMPIIGTQYELMNTENLNTVINDNIESLIGINQDLGYLAGHGAPDISGPPRGMRGQQGGESLQNLNQHLSKAYTIKTIDLAGGDRIGQSLNCLVIAQPTQPFSDYELYQIDQALMNGTNLAIFSDAYKESEQQGQQQMRMNQPTHVPMDTGLKKLLAHYGVRLRDAYVLDKNCYKQRLPQRAGGGERPIYYAPVIKNKHINKDLDFMKNIKGMVTLQNSPLELVSERIKAQEAQAHQLFASSDQSWLKKGETSLNPMFLQPPQDEAEFDSYPLACLLEGEFESYFKGKSLPVKKVEEETGESASETEGPTRESAAQDELDENQAEVDLSKIEADRDFKETGEPAQIAVVGTSSILKDMLVDQDGISPNTTFVLNMIDVLNERADIAAMRSKTQRLNPLEETTAATRTGVKLFNIAGLPVLVVCFGLFAWWRRRVRRKRIRKMFQA